MDRSIIVNVRDEDMRVLLLRGQKVMLDQDLAKLYRVETKVLNQAVRRNIERFPDDFMFHLSKRRMQRSRDFNRRYREKVFTIRIY